MMAFALRIGTPTVTGRPDNVNSFVRLPRGSYDLTATDGPGKVTGEMTTSAHTPVLSAAIIFVVILILPL